MYRMKKYFFLILITGFCQTVLLCGAQPSADPPGIGHVDTIASTLLKEQRVLWIYQPRGESNPAMAPKIFPVLYLLDGDDHFPYVVSLVRRLSEGFSHVLPEMIIVGISNTNRMRDLTPTHIRRTRTISDTSVFRETGGGAVFLSFMEKELFPYISERYPANAFRVLAGHSLGGLMVADAMVSRPGLCQGWISIDPSLWYDDQYLLRSLDQTGKAEVRKPASFFMAMANNLPAGMDTLRMHRDSSAVTEDNRAISNFARRLETNPLPDLSWSWKFYPDDDHGSVTSIALYDGLRYVFRDYRLPAFSDLLAPDADPVRMLEEWSERNTGRWGFRVHPPESFMNALGYAFMQRKQLPEAERIFRANIDAYPGSANAYDSMGDCQLALGQPQRARFFYEQSLRVRENSATRAKLGQLPK
jgi:predicted alpha/beta superfamily hydrolase